MTTIGDRGPDPVPGLLQCGVGEADQVHTGQAGVDIGLDLDDVAVESADRDRERPSQRHQPTPCRCSTSGVRRRPMRTPMTSMRICLQPQS